jgi:hypothetical protein
MVMSVNEKMTAIANEIRELNGINTTIGLTEMASNLSTTNSEIDEQSETLV